MRDATANFQSAYTRPKRVFTYGPEDLSDVSRHIVRRDLQHHSAAVIEAPSCQTKGGILASGKYNFSAPHCSRDVSKYVPRENVDHRAIPQADLAGAETSGLIQPVVLQNILDRHDRVLHELREDV